jgi:hypothetical protein
MDTKVKEYIDAITDDTRRKDITLLIALIAKCSSETPKMWGSSIISFGTYHYVYDSGREGDAPKIGLSNRKQAITLYGLHISDSEHPNSKLVEQLGKYKTGKGCLYLSSLSTVDMAILEQMICLASTSSAG